MRYLLLFLFLPALLACEQTLPVEANNPCESGNFPQSGIAGDPSDLVWVIHEGNFQRGNASLGWYNPSSESWYQEVYDSLNQEILGDVFQSITIAEEKAYLVINNSQKIIVASASSGIKEGEITGLQSPRYLLPVSSVKAYVSDLYANAISIIDLQTNQNTGQIHLPGWTERMIKTGNKVFVTNLRSEYLYVIDPSTDQLSDSIRVGLGSSSVVEAADRTLWVACSGDVLNEVPGSLVQVDPVTLSVLQTLEFEGNERPSSLTTGPLGELLYYLNEDCFVMDISADSLPGCPIIDAEGGLFYGLGIDPGNGDIYLADAIDYVQRGALLRYRKSGVLLHEWRGGIIPAGFAFQ